MLDEMNAREYLYQHLKERVLQGGYRKEFRIVKKNISEFAEFKSFQHLLEITDKESLCDIKEMAVREVVELYQREENLRPASGVVLVMLLWERMVKIAPGDRFDSAVYWLFEEAQCINTDNPGIIDDLIRVIKKKMFGDKYYSSRPDKKRYFKNWRTILEEEDEGNETADYADFTDNEEEI